MAELVGGRRLDAVELDGRIYIFREGGLAQWDEAELSTNQLEAYADIVLDKHGRVKKHRTATRCGPNCQRDMKPKCHGFY